VGCGLANRSAVTLGDSFGLKKDCGLANRSAVTLGDGLGLSVSDH
jgi:hypothetical protein